MQDAHALSTTPPASLLLFRSQSLANTRRANASAHFMQTDGVCIFLSLSVSSARALSLSLSSFVSSHKDPLKFDSRVA